MLTPNQREGLDQRSKVVFDTLLEPFLPKIGPEPIVIDRAAAQLAVTREKEGVVDLTRAAEQLAVWKQGEIDELRFRIRETVCDISPHLTRGAIYRLLSEVLYGESVSRSPILSENVVQQRIIDYAAEYYPDHDRVIQAIRRFSYRSNRRLGVVGSSSRWEKAYFDACKVYRGETVSGNFSHLGTLILQALRLTQGESSNKIVDFPGVGREAVSESESTVESEIAPENEAKILRVSFGQKKAEKKEGSYSSFVKMSWAFLGIKDRWQFHVLVNSGKWRETIVVNDSLMTVLLRRKVDTHGRPNHALLNEIGDLIYDPFDLDLVKDFVADVFARQNISSYQSCLECTSEQINKWFVQELAIRDVNAEDFTLFNVLAVFDPAIGQRVLPTNEEMVRALAEIVFTSR